MEFEIAVVSLLVIVYIILIIIVCLIIYVCLKLRAINQSGWNIDDNPLYSQNRPQTTQTIETTSDHETVFQANTRSNSSLTADSVDSLHNSNSSHIYEDIEDMYIDDSLPRNLDKISNNPNFPEPFYYCLDAESEQCSCKDTCGCQKDVSV